MQPVRMFQVKIVMGVALLAAAYCAAAGRIDLWPGWCYAGFALVTLAASYVALACRRDAVGQADRHGGDLCGLPADDW